MDGDGDAVSVMAVMVVVVVYDSDVGGGRWAVNDDDVGAVDDVDAVVCVRMVVTMGGDDGDGWRWCR